MIGFRTSIPQSPSVRSRRSSTTGAASVARETALIPRNVPALRTLDDVRDQVAQEIAVHTITKAKVQDGVRIGVRLVMSKSEDEEFIRQVAVRLSDQLTLYQHLFAVATTAQSARSEASTLIIFGSSADYVQRAVLLASSKFIGRVVSVTSDGAADFWVASVQDLGVSPYDEDALWDVVRKAARAPMDPLLPPPGARGIAEILAEARARIQRITPAQAFEELRESQVGAPTFLVDIRPQAQREAKGGIHGSLIIERNVLEWRFDPRCASRLTIADRYDLRIIIFCQEGYTSSLAAYSLHQIGLLNTTDIIGGYEAWRGAGLPMDLNRPESESLVEIAGALV